MVQLNLLQIRTQQFSEPRLRGSREIEPGPAAPDHEQLKVKSSYRPQSNSSDESLQKRSEASMFDARGLRRGRSSSEAVSVLGSSRVNRLLIGVDGTAVCLQPIARRTIWGRTRWFLSLPSSSPPPARIQPITTAPVRQR
jgi:hypothetical protein